MKTVAQLTYIPLNTEDPRTKVQELLEHLAQFDGIQIEVGYLSTSIIGDYGHIFNILRELYEIMLDETKDFRFHVELLSPLSSEE